MDHDGIEYEFPGYVRRLQAAADACDHATLVEHVIDGIADNNKINDGKWSDWTAIDAVMCYLEDVRMNKAVFAEVVRLVGCKLAAV